MLELVIKSVANKREVPDSLPPMAWFEEMRALAVLPDRDELLAEMAWWHPVMEFLEPVLLLRLKVQALVWRHHMGSFPDEVAYWWPVRQGRRRGQVPSQSWAVDCRINQDGVLHCGFCSARWSAHRDGSPHASRCKLCDRFSIIVSDAREKHGVTA